MNILDLPLKAIWYDMIESGEKKRSIENIIAIGLKDFMFAMIKTRIAESIFPKSVNIVVSLPLSFMMLFVFVTDIQNELCYSN